MAGLGLTEPSTRVVPAGRYSFRTRKSRSHDGWPAGWSRQASTEIGTLPPSAAWVTVFSKTCGWIAVENPAASGLPSSDGVSAQ